MSVFADSWQEGIRMRPPAGMALDEFGHASFIAMQEWTSTEALFCRRDRAKKRVEDPHQNIWLPATIEVLDAVPAPVEKRKFRPDNLSEKEHFGPSFLGLVLSDVFPEAAELDELLLPQAVKLADKAMKKAGLSPQGDFSFEGPDPKGPPEYTCRVYTGLPDSFGVVSTADGSFELILLSLLGDGRWIVTGFADDIGTRLSRIGGSPKILLECLDEGFPKIVAAHKKSLSKANQPPEPAPKDFNEAVAVYAKFVAALFD